MHPVVDAYVAAVNSGDATAVMALFAEGARVTNPLGTFSGIDEVSGFYRDVVLAGKAVLTPGTVAVAGAVVMAELKASSPLDPAAGELHALDVFRLDAHGRIESLEIYYR